MNPAHAVFSPQVSGLRFGRTLPPRCGCCNSKGFESGAGERKEFLEKSESVYLSKFGFRLQYSVFEITNSDTVLKNIEAEIQNKYIRLFTEEDSVIIFNLSETCKKTCYGYAKNEEKEVFVIG